MFYLDIEGLQVKTNLVEPNGVVKVDFFFEDFCKFVEDFPDFIWRSLGHFLKTAYKITRDSFRFGRFRIRASLKEGLLG
jgi:hypothetical protein